MPAPPRKGETREAFVSRCISELSGAGEGESAQQRAAICYSMWERRNKGVENKDPKENIPKDGMPKNIAGFYEEFPEIPEGERPKNYLDVLEDELRNP